MKNPNLVSENENKFLKTHGAILISYLGLQCATFSINECVSYSFKENETHHSKEI